MSERGFGRARHGDDLDGKPFQSRNEVEQFFRFPRIAEGQDDVAVIDDAEIAMKGIDTVEHDAGGARAGEGGGNFLADVAGLADAEDDDFAALLEGEDDGLD